MFKRAKRARRGANAIEFGLTLPVFILVIFGLIEYGFCFAQIAMLDIAVTEGCREGSLVDPLYADPGDAAVLEMASVLGDLGLNCAGYATCTAQDSGAPLGTETRRLTCRIEAEYVSLTGLDLVPMPEFISSENVARLEWQRN